VKKPKPFPDVPFHLYLYLIRTYIRFFLTGKSLDFPLVVQLQTQSYCNGQCAICPYPETSKKIDHGFMDEKLFDKIVDELATEKKTRTLVFALQNEPLLDSRIFDLIQKLKSKRKDIYCMLVTNGESLDKFSQEKIDESGLDQLYISLNAHSKETYKQINTGIDFEKVMNNIRSIISNPSLRQKVSIRFALNQKNAAEIQAAQEYWKKQGVRTMVSRITNRAGALRAYDSFKISNSAYTGHQLLRYWKNIMAVLRNIIGCELPFHHMNILYNGDVIICCHDWNRSIIIGNVTTKSIKSVWNSEKINEIRRNVNKKNYSRISSCNECSLTK
jgi:radical SAM protein with 4Fe4S-binding SPASM domain